MKEIKVPGEVRQLVKLWRHRAQIIERYFGDDPHGYTRYQTYLKCAEHLEAALKRPVQRAKKLAKKGKTK